MLRVWLEPKGHSVEGHTAQCTLSFKGRVVWGPHSCHNNTAKLADALHAADSRFRLTIRNKHKTIEGHTYTVSLMAGGHLYLDRLSTHASILGLCQAINDCIASGGDS
ncbi:hypothetical protein QBC38DRAFT_374693 [Podospora fimiseda]|uniref:Uncharacterized protein n=1 Tax=Podospora fimiseda TaxID=252190 RepID=A0AAN6YR86_9PEZI|nr:hypothetical protein QBC38DRAFT_374693 [Podospora fimiseda]